jgi:hypothetical protein
MFNLRLQFPVLDTAQQVLARRVVRLILFGVIIGSVIIAVAIQPNLLAASPV